MKINKIAIISGVFLLPILLNAQENVTGNNILTEINESGVTFTIPNMTDSTEIVSIRRVMEEELTRQQSTQRKDLIIDSLRDTIKRACPNITDEELNNVAENISTSINNRHPRIPEISCDEKYVYTHYYGYNKEGEYRTSELYFAYDIKTGRWMGSVNRPGQFGDLDRLLSSPQKEERPTPIENINEFAAKIHAHDVVYDKNYLYALHTRDAYDDDYGPYYYTEWKITQYSISTGKVLAGTDYREGMGAFVTFKELEAQKDFGPVKRCQLAQLAFQAMHEQENMNK